MQTPLSQATFLYLVPASNQTIAEPYHALPPLLLPPLLLSSSLLPPLLFPPLPTSFIHSRVIVRHFELPLCLLWAHFALTQCGRLMAVIRQGRLGPASATALNSLHQFPPVLLSPSHRQRRGGGGGGYRAVTGGGHMRPAGTEA
uniref:Uncharacterized protein n=1 Tax=Knipowitschia caucasica TaxID=637954 RepID=A0AAV2MHT2_KNICA